MTATHPTAAFHSTLKVVRTYMVHSTLKAARAYILLDRDCLYESISLQDGTIPDPKDAEDLAKVDALLDQIDAALGATS